LGLVVNKQNLMREQYLQQVALFLEKEATSSVITEFGLTPHVDSATLSQAKLAIELNRSKGFSLREMRLEMKIIGACIETYADYKVSSIYKVIADNHVDRVKAIDTLCSVYRNDLVDSVPHDGIKLAKLLVSETEESYLGKARVCGKKFTKLREFQRDIETTIEEKLGLIEKKIVKEVPKGTDSNLDKEKVLREILQDLGLRPRHVSGNAKSYKIKYHVTHNGLGLDLSFAMTDSPWFLNSVSLFIDKVTYPMSESNKKELIEIIGENNIGEKIEILSRSGNGEIHNMLGSDKSDVYVRLYKIAYGETCNEFMNIE